MEFIETLLFNLGACLIIILVLCLGVAFVFFAGKFAGAIGVILAIAIEVALFVTLDDLC